MCVLDEIKIKEKGKSVFFSVALIESVLAALLILGIIVVKFFLKEQYTGIKKWYMENMTVDTNISEIIEEAKDEI